MSGNYCLIDSEPAKTSKLIMTPTDRLEQASWLNVHAWARLLPQKRMFQILADVASVF
ncbi:hypothetical protein MiSe_42840 [Microseira wollei NIES-4236]|uniref:Uncharacterized protein n=1 Tax=Microseira wollei NIES-4236 TaxID=2530354 RepID=A0AAV3XCC8_9CYAN|nr:hypothetical protein MiSe_42840 [Microseira wollei NIES-4236]